MFGQETAPVDFAKAQVVPVLVEQGVENFVPGCNLLVGEILVYLLL